MVAVIYGVNSRAGCFIYPGYFRPRKVVSNLYVLTCYGGKKIDIFLILSMYANIYPALCVVKKKEEEEVEENFGTGYEDGQYPFVLYIY